MRGAAGARAARSGAVPAGGRCWRLIGKPLAPVLRPLGLKPMAAMLRLTPRRKPPPPIERTGKVYRGAGRAPRPGRAAVRLRRPVLAPATNEAAIRVLNRHGIEVVVAEGEGCCGSLVHHMGREAAGAGAGAQQYRRLDAGDRWRRARRHSDHGVGLRHHGEGLRLHAARRSRPMRRRQRASPRSPAT